MAEKTEIPVANPDAELPLLEDAPGSASPTGASLSVRLVTLGVILVPLVAMIAAPFFAWGWGFHWADLSLLLGMYFCTSLGIAVGYHRLFVHRSFDSYPWVQFVWAVFGSMAVQGSLFWWVATHRRHHQHSDTVYDPHSPQNGGKGVLGLLRGFWHAHIGWFFDPDPPDLERYIRDLRANKFLVVANSLFPLWVALGFAIPAILGGLFTQSWTGFWTGLLWGGLVRLFLVHHVTWSVNSACHLWGLRPYKSQDESRNNFIFGVLAMGEGWHNTHHAFPTSARHGLRWWQIDMSYLVILLMSKLHLAWNVKLPTMQAQAVKRRID